VVCEQEKAASGILSMQLGFTVQADSFNKFGTVNNFWKKLRTAVS